MLNDLVQFLHRLFPGTVVLRMLKVRKTLRASHQ